MKHGLGHWRKAANEEYCSKYSGMYKKDMKHGFGEFEWKNGSKYVGNYVKDKKQGYGDMKWADGH